MYACCAALRDCLLAVGPGIDGGKDSLSMAARVGAELVRAPGQLALTCYVTCPDIRRTVTPDFKAPGLGKILYVDLGAGNSRVGGSALSTVFNQVGIDEIGVRRLLRCVDVMCIDCTPQHAA